MSPETTAADSAVSNPAKKEPASVRRDEAVTSLVGQIIDDKYRIEAMLGRGGMGVVYRARRLRIGDSVAVKILHPDRRADPHAAERFSREAQAAARVKHPNVVIIHDFGVSDDGLIYLVEELVEGIDLRSLIKREGRLSMETTAEIVHEVCAALDEAHRQNVVHRDLKPENIVLRDTPAGSRVKVLDFGIASIRDFSDHKLTETGVVVGTPHYMSPEQCMGEAVDGRSDIYSLGIILYEMLAGVVPFKMTTPTAVVVQQVNQAPPPLSTHGLIVSPEVEAVVRLALEKRPETRPQTASALARELLAAIRGDQSALTSLADESQITSEEPSFCAAPTTRKRNKRAPLIIGLLSVLAIGAGLGLWRHLQNDRNNQAIGVSVLPLDKQASASLRSNGDQVPEHNAAAGASGNVDPPSPGANLWEVIPDQTSGAENVENVSGQPDRKLATIKPGGQIALTLHDGEFFTDGPGIDLRIYSPESGIASYTVNVRDNPAETWRRVYMSRRSFPQGVAGHDIGHHGLQRARQVMIKNNAGAELHLDAVIAGYKDNTGGTESRHRHH